MSTSLSGGLQGGMQGAQMGAQFGPYGALIGGVVGGVLGIFEAKEQKERLKAFNSQVVRNAAQQMFDLQRQRGIENLRTSQALDAYSDQRRVTMGNFNANFGAADIIGSSADALKQTLDFQTNQAKRQVWIDWDIGVDNQNTTLNQITNAATAQLQRKIGGQQQDLTSVFKSGLDLYSKYKTNNTLKVQTGQPASGLGSLSDFGSFGKSGSATGIPSFGALFG